MSKILHETRQGAYYLGDAVKLLDKKGYGNLQGEEYKE